VDVALDDPPLSVAAIARADAVVTTCAHAVADTGTVVLAGGPGEGRRVLSLLSDLHVCVVEAARIVPSLDAAFASLAGVTGPVTLVSGPSATSDIELTRVEGVHGPRRLEVVVVGA
jgi:L-lactate dehydrogenase complex protein LldG